MTPRMVGKAADRKGFPEKLVGLRLMGSQGVPEQRDDVNHQHIKQPKG